MEEEKLKQRWKQYFDNILSQENSRERREMRTEERERTWKISLEKKSGPG